jgi:3-oxoacyl-[acyl-carrier protein] reductase
VNIRFDARNVIVTGAAHGFGREIARQFVALGATVWACDVIADELEETRALCGAACHTRVVDVTSAAAVGTFVAEAAARNGAVHVLVNNAGGVLGQEGRPLEFVAPDEWQAVIDVNVTGSFYLCQAVAPAMKHAGYGRIVNISSGAGLGVSLTGNQAYAAAKAAQIGLTRQLAHELGPFGITVNSIAPGFVRSNSTTERQWQSYGAEGQHQLLERIALRRLGTPADIAHAALFFASDFAGWITGEVLSVAGGRNRARSRCARRGRSQSRRRPRLRRRAR